MCHIYIYGPPASGKTSLGRRLAQQLALPFTDLDKVIETQAGQSIPDIFAAEGETAFRRRESSALQEVLKGQPAVIALGGGALLSDANRSQTEANGQVLCLDADFETIIARLEGAETQRPLLDGDTRQRLKMLLDARHPHYASFPSRLDTTDLSADEAAWQAQIALGCFRITGMGAAYDVRVEPGGLDELGHMLHQRGLRGPLALVTDDHVAGLHGGHATAALQQAGYAVQTVIIPAGEAHKTIDTVCRLWNGYLQSGLERRSTVVALGGGVVGDLAGFAAATYLRGVPWVAVPTTLLAMVDASLGGKTGADLPQGKNLIGAFHPPSFVLADPHLLDTLPEVELRNGLAEAVKHGILDDPALFALCEQGWQAVNARRDELVRRAMAVKLRVIQEDPYERGRRAILNLGHTLGHALEAASDFRLRHGEAVAIGMVQAARLAERRSLAETGLADRIAAALRGLGLPTQIPVDLDRSRIIAAIGVDKKRAGGQVRLVLPLRIGEACWGIPLDDPVELLSQNR